MRTDKANRFAWSQSGKENQHGEQRKDLRGGTRVPEECSEEKHGTTEDEEKIHTKKDEK